LVKPGYLGQTGSPLATHNSSFGRFVHADTTRERKLQEKTEKRRLKGGNKMDKEHKKSLLRGQRLEERLRLEDYKMRSSRVDKLQFWLNRYQVRAQGLERELQLINAHLERMRGVIAERTLQSQQQQPLQTHTQTVVTTTTYPTV